ncbi:unnamed protein product [Cladocopium goreaui]|uniref:Dynein, axonemal, light intermediate chain 1 n=1 Tax=Cladocopium goreaui TaxID=2562237 RepID=A0A9P1C7A5_9DINO|nr:unnamed protein product [Cladocopium goreaui]
MAALHLGRIVKGSTCGDPAFDQLSLDVLRQLANSGTLLRSSSQRASYCAAKVPARVTLRLPCWADRPKMRRGQQVFRDHGFDFFCAFEIALIWGCRVDRFADVLVRSGYTSSPKSAFRRFHETLRHVLTWCCDEGLAVDDVSETTQSILKVRAMHALVRRRCRDGHAEMPISQYDLAFTLMAFGIISLDIVLNGFQRSLSDQEIDDWLHLWRVLGNLHGILDEFNPCNDVNDAAGILQDINELFYFAAEGFQGGHARNLTLAVCEGFSTWGKGLGGHLLGAMFLRSLRAKRFISSESIEWIPFGQAFFEEHHGNASLACRGQHIACALIDLVISVLSQRPSLDRAFQRGYFYLLRWAVVQRNIPMMETEMIVRCLSFFIDLIFKLLALLTCGAIDNVCISRNRCECRREVHFRQWQEHLDGFRHIGPSSDLTCLTLPRLLRSCYRNPGIALLVLVAFFTCTKTSCLRIGF